MQSLSFQTSLSVQTHCCIWDTSKFSVFQQEPRKLWASKFSMMHISQLRDMMLHRQTGPHIFNMAIMIFVFTMTAACLSKPVCFILRKHYCTLLRSCLPFTLLKNKFSYVRTSTSRTIIWKQTNSVQKKCLVFTVCVITCCVVTKSADGMEIIWLSIGRPKLISSCTQRTTVIKFYLGCLCHWKYAIVHPNREKVSIIKL